MRRGEKSDRFSRASDTASAGASSSNCRISASPSESLATALLAASPTKNSTSPVIRITGGDCPNDGRSSSEKRDFGTKSVYFRSTPKRATMRQASISVRGVSDVTEGEELRKRQREQTLRYAQDDTSERVAQQIGMPPVFAAREVSQKGGGARRGSEAPELMSPQGEIQAERAKRRVGGRGFEPLTSCV